MVLSRSGGPAFLSRSRLQSLTVLLFGLYWARLFTRSFPLPAHRRRRNKSARWLTGRSSSERRPVFRILAGPLRPTDKRQAGLARTIQECGIAMLATNVESYHGCILLAETLVSFLVAVPGSRLSTNCGRAIRSQDRRTADRRVASTVIVTLFFIVA